MFIEEPVLSENYEALKELAPLTSTPIALGERLYSRWDFNRILQAGYVDNYLDRSTLSVAAPKLSAGLAINPTKGGFHPMEKFSVQA